LERLTTGEGRSEKERNKKWKKSEVEGPLYRARRPTVDTAVAPRTTYPAM